MVSSLDREVIRIYDDRLSKYPHISSLKIDKENFKRCLTDIYYNRRYKDEDLDHAHSSQIGNIVFNKDISDMANAKKYIIYPDFVVNTYLENPEYIAKDKHSLEKSVLIAKKQELNIVLGNPKFRGSLSHQFMLVLSIEKIVLAPDVFHFKVAINKIHWKMFHEFYTAVTEGKIPYLGLTNEETMWYRNIAIHDSLIALKRGFNNVEVEEELITYGYKDYERFKQFIKSKYGVEYVDIFRNAQGDEQPMWLNLGFIQYDNRIKANVYGSEEIIPLSLQKTLNKKID